MQFQPKTEKQIIEAGLWPAGQYDFEVTKAERALSGAQSKEPGTEFIKINVRLWNAEGSTRFVNGILHPAMEAQLRHFCDAGGLLAKYEAGTLEAHDCIGVSGRLKLKIKAEQGDFPAKNEIADFIVPKRENVTNNAPAAKPKSEAQAKDAAADSDIPF